MLLLALLQLPPPDYQQQPVPKAGVQAEARMPAPATRLCALQLQEQVDAFLRAQAAAGAASSDDSMSDGEVAELPAVEHAAGFERYKASGAAALGQGLLPGFGKVLTQLQGSLSRQQVHAWAQHHVTCPHDTSCRAPPSCWVCRGLTPRHMRMKQRSMLT